jgi:hypothetical protein
MNLKKLKWPFYIFTFLLVNLVATILKLLNGKKIPQVVDAVSLVGFFYAVVYGVFRLVSFIINRKKDKLAKHVLFSKIESKKTAIKSIRDISSVFLILAAIQLGLGLFFHMTGLIIESVIWAILALLLRKFNSRIVAILLLLLSLYGLINGVINQFGGGEAGNIFFGVILFYASIKSVQATFKYNYEK